MSKNAYDPQNIDLLAKRHGMPFSTQSASRTRGHGACLPNLNTNNLVYLTYTEVHQLQLRKIAKKRDLTIVCFSNENFNIVATLLARIPSAMQDVQRECASWVVQAAEQAAPGTRYVGSRKEQRQKSEVCCAYFPTG